MKQFSGYFGCPKCKERGQQHVIGIGKGGRKRQCHVYPYNSNFSDGHCEVRCHQQVKAQVLQVLRNRKDGLKSNYDVEGILGLSWAFGIPKFDMVRGTAIDYMHCICEGVVEQLLNSWFSQDKKGQLFFLGDKLEALDKDLQSIMPISEITRTPRSILDKKDWKASEKKNFLCYYAVPLLLDRLPKVYVTHLMLLVGATYHLLKESISVADREDAAVFLKLFCAQASALYVMKNEVQFVHLSLVTICAR